MVVFQETMKPKDLDQGKRLYEEFHKLNPGSTGKFNDSFKIPPTVYLLGNAVSVSYRSSKWGRKADYIHEHDSGVKIYSPKKGSGGVAAKVPSWITEITTLVRLGECLEFEFSDGKDVHRAHAPRPYPELYTIPSGKALLVIEDKRLLHAIIWGGSLSVKPEGIVH